MTAFTEVASVSISLRRTMRLHVTIAALAIVGARLPAGAQGQQVNAGNGDNINVGGQTVSTNAVPALLAHDGGRIFNSVGAGNDVTVTTTGIAGFGAEASSGGAINLDGGGTITTIDNNSFGLYSTGTNSTITSAVDVTTSGENALGAYARLDGTITLNGGVITTNGMHGAGLVALGGGFLTSVADVTTHGLAAHGVEAGGGGAIFLNGGSVTTTNGSSHGLYVEPTGGSITSVVDITTSGPGAIGAYAEGGMITLNGGTVTTTGTSAHGLEARGAGVLNATGVTVNVSGPTAAGMAVADGGTLTLTNSVVTSAQQMAAASQAQTGLTNTYLIRDSQLSSATDLAMTAQGGLHNYTLENSQVMSGNGQLMQVQQRVIGPDTFPTQLNLEATGSTLVGDIQILDPGTNTADVILSQGTTWTGAAEDVTNLTLMNSTWNMTGSSTITGTLINNPSVIEFSPPVGDPTLLSNYKTLTVNNYHGAGGTIVLNTFLGGDGAPSDRLIIDGGSATGTTLLVIRNTGGAGAETTGDGILLVETTGGGTTDPNAFALAGPVSMGAYSYDLFRGGASDPNDWFLQSELRSATAVYSIVPSLAQEFGASLLGTLHRRVGQQEQLRCQGGCDGGWGRVLGVTGDRTPGNPDSGAPFDYDLWAVQAGRDLYRGEYAGGSHEHAGLYLAGGGASADVRALDGTDAGNVWFGGYSLGGYWTWYGPGQEYLDAVLQSTWYDARASTHDGYRVEPVGWGGAASLEGGYPLVVSREWMLEPQAQVLYQGIHFGAVQDAASSVAFRDADSLRGRAGLRLAQTRGLSPHSGASRLLTVALTADAWREFEGDNGTTIAALDGGNPQSFLSNLGGSWGEVGGDATMQLNRHASFYGSGQYGRGFDANRDAWTGSIGLRVNW